MSGFFGQLHASLTAGTINSTANVSAGSLGSVTTKGDMNGSLTVGSSSTPLKVTVAGNYGACGNLGEPAYHRNHRKHDAQRVVQIIDSNNLTSACRQGFDGGRSPSSMARSPASLRRR